VTGSPPTIDSVEAGPPAPGPGPVTRGLLRGVRAYQLARSGRPTGCRFVPSCSEYAVQAVEEHGTLRGGWLAVKRIARCHPWGGHGVDPVPDRRVSCSPR
jgi:uncharacterized protein